MITFLKTYGTLILGPIIALCILFIPSELDYLQQRFLAIFSLTVFYWLFGNIPLFVTGFLGVSLSIIFGLDSASKILASFSNSIIFLFLGGFLLAKAFNNSGLDNRISLYLLTRKFIKGSISKLILVLILLTAIFSMWISNTATVAMMLPLVIGALKSLKITNKKTISLILLSIAYSASIGGIGTPIGSTPNIIGIGMLSELINIKLTFFDWIKIGMPLSFLFLFILFFIIKFSIRNDQIYFDNSFLLKEYKKLPTLSSYEIQTFIVFISTVFFWLLPSIGQLLSFKIPINLDPGVVVLFTSSILFILPFNSERKILLASDIKNIDWSSLLLFGAGIALGKLLFDLGLANMAGNYLITLVREWNLFLLLLILFGSIIFFTEFTSNTASANIIIPIIISLSTKLNLDPILMTMGVSIACSLAFMLPIATPPNAIVYGTEMVSKDEMLKNGFFLNIIFSLLLTMIVYLIA